MKFNHSFYLRNRVKPYVLFLVGRVGSTYLTSLLNAHPQVVALAEELADLEDAGSNAQLKWTRSFLTPPLIGKIGARGFNVKLVHLVDPDAFAALLEDLNCQVIHLFRRNRVKAVISRINGERLWKKTGMWGLFDDSNRPPLLTVDPEKFDEYLRHREKMDFELEEYISQLKRPTLSLSYEELLRNEDNFLHTVFSFLNLPYTSVQGTTLKITSDDLKQAIDNFEELRSKYLGTPYESMFDEVIIP